MDACVDISGPILAINDALSPAIDVLVTGHTHLPYNCVLPDSAGQPRIVTSAYSYGRVVSEMDLVIDKRTNDIRRDLSVATNHIVDQSALTPDPAITAVLDKWDPLFEEADSIVLGTITADINGVDPSGITVASNRRPATWSPTLSLGHVFKRRSDGVHEPGWGAF